MIIVIINLYLLPTTYGGLNNGPQSYLCPHPQNLGTWQRSYEVEDFEIGRVFWITQVGPKYNHKAPCKREARRSQEEKVADDRSRGCRDVASSLQEPERASSGFSPGASRRSQPANTLTL